MKKRSLLILSIVVTILLLGGVIAAFYFGGKDDNRGEKCVPLTDDVAFYVNVDNLVTKSAIREVFTSANMSLLANVVAAETEGEINSDYMVSIFENLDSIGLNSKSPVYGYANNGDSAQELTIVAEVCDAAKVDNFINFVATATGEELEIVRNKDTRLVLCDGFVIGYNAERCVVVTQSEDDSLALLNEALGRPKADLSKFKKYDIAGSIMLNPIVTLMRNNMQEQLAAEREYLQESTNVWEIEWIEEQIANTEKSIASLNNIDSHITDDANALLGLTFESGRATAELIIDGYEAEYMLDKKVAHNHIDYIDKDALAVVNMGVNSTEVSKLLSKVISPEYADMLGVSRNEFNLYVSIACDAIESINGDVTLVLNDIYGGYYGIDGIDAFAAIDVADNYIISNIATYGQGILTRKSKDNYSLNFGGYYFTVGQQDDTLYATVNMDYKESLAPASDADWYKDIEDSYAYILLNADSIFNNSMISAMWRQVLNDIDDAEAQYIDSLTKAISYIYLTANTPTSAQLVIVFDDKQTNALEQAFKPLASLVIREAMREIF
jgi:hypothetical protein